MKYLLLACLLNVALLHAQKPKSFNVQSPDGNVTAHIEAADKLQWSVQYAGQSIIEPSAISMQLQDGSVLGDKANITSAPVTKVNAVFKAINYRTSNITDTYTQLTLNCKGDYGIIFRVYNDAVAYRFFTKKKGGLIVKNEEATFNFANDDKAFIPIQWDYRDGKIFNSSFEALYHEMNLSQFPKDSLAFLPLLVDVGQNRKVAILEADLEAYPGMYLNLNATQKGLSGVYAPYPLEAKLSGINYIPTTRADYIAKTEGTRSFPWRAIAISQADKDLLNNSIVQKLASPSRIADPSWVEPGQSAWEWWNAISISHVDFKAGINTATYKYFVDFASANKLKYIILDGGWSNGNNLSQATANVDLPQIVDYGKQKGVGIILWASWYNIMQQMDTVFPLYSKMGVKGWKIDFIDRDDQLAVASTYNIAKNAAEYKMFVDYHGAFKPTGLQRTYPNVVGYEGVKGLENYKWANEDQPRYTVTIPFIRMLAGPMDYTPGSMHNTVNADYHPVNNRPMTKGTRCNQMAMYVVFDAPIQMLSDDPTSYMREQECTNFITKVPTTFDETVPLDGKVGEYVAVAHRKGDTWFAAAMTNSNARELTLDCSFLPAGTYEAEVFRDGINADRDATDYKKETVKINSGDKIKIALAPGGGWVARMQKI